MFDSITIQRKTLILIAATSAVVIFAFLLVRTASAGAGDNANSNNQGNGEVIAQLAMVQQQLADLQAEMDTRLNTIDSTLVSLGTDLGEHDASVKASLGSETD